VRWSGEVVLPVRSGAYTCSATAASVASSSSPWAPDENRVAKTRVAAARVGAETDLVGARTAGARRVRRAGACATAGGSAARNASRLTRPGSATRFMAFSSAGTKVDIASSSVTVAAKKSSKARRTCGGGAVLERATAAM